MFDFQTFEHGTSGMNAAVRAVTRMGIYVGAKVYLIYEVSKSVVCFCKTCTLNRLLIISESVLLSLTLINEIECGLAGIPRPGGWGRQHQTGTLAQCDQHHPAGGLKTWIYIYINNFNNKDGMFSHLCIFSIPFTRKSPLLWKMLMGLHFIRVFT